MLVIDANVALEACGQEDGFQALEDDLSAPPLMWSEARANLHLSLINGEITLVTIDMRLWRGAKRLGLVITPNEVEPKPDPKHS